MSTMDRQPCECSELREISMVGYTGHHKLPMGYDKILIVTSHYFLEQFVRPKITVIRRFPSGHRDLKL